MDHAEAKNSEEEERKKQRKWPHKTRQGINEIAIKNHEDIAKEGLQTLSYFFLGKALF